MHPFSCESFWGEDVEVSSLGCKYTEQPESVQCSYSKKWFVLPALLVETGRRNPRPTIPLVSRPFHAGVVLCPLVSTLLREGESDPDLQPALLPGLKGQPIRSTKKALNLPLHVEDTNML
jgi:hypothetical protein